MLTTTLRLLRRYSACDDGYAKLSAHLGPGYGDNAPIPLATILESNGVDDALWSMRAVLDAITSIVFADDCQACTLLATKVYGEVPGCEITVKEA